MATLVVFEVGRLKKPLFTEVTLVETLIFVRTDVSAEVAALGERFLAVFTHERSLPSVQTTVVEEMARLLENHTAVIAPVATGLQTLLLGLVEDRHFSRGFGT